MSERQAEDNAGLSGETEPEWLTVSRFYSEWPQAAHDAAAARLREELPGLTGPHAGEAAFEQAWNAALRAGLATDAWRPIDDSTPTGIANPVLVAVTGGPNGDVVGEAYCRDEGDSDDGWWWANTGPSDYYASPIDDIQHGRVTHWMPKPAGPASCLIVPDYRS